MMIRMKKIANIDSKKKLLIKNDNSMKDMIYTIVEFNFTPQENICHITRSIQNIH